MLTKCWPSHGSSLNVTMDCKNSQILAPINVAGDAVSINIARGIPLTL